jgi:Tfp pilus assembly protein PilP
LIVGLLLTACSVGGVYVTLRFNIGGIRYLPPQTPTLSSLESGPVSPFTVQHKTKVIGADSSGQTQTREVAQRQTRQRGMHNIVPAEKAGSGASALSPGLSAQVTISPEPDRKTLKPIGYVQKANGLVEAIVSEGDGVQVVHEGEVFEEKYTVARISPEAVEIVASSAPPTVLSSASTIASNSTLGNRRGTEALASSSKPLPSQATLRAPKQVADSKGRPVLVEKARARIDEPEFQASVHQADSRRVALAAPTFNLPKAIGYAEMSAGTRITVVPDGEFVRLVQPEDTLAGRGGIEKGSKAVEIASAPEPTAPKQAATNFNRIKAQPVHLIHNATPTQTLKTLSDGIVSSQHVTPGIPSGKLWIDDHPLVASRTLGFVEKADGRVQAIVDEGEGVRFVQVGDSLPRTLLAGGDSAKAAEGGHTSLVPPAPPPVILASARSGKGAPPGLPPGWHMSSPPDLVQTGDPFREKDSALGGSHQPWEPPDKPPPGLQVPVADDRVVPEKPPPDDVITAMGLEAEVGGPSKRDEAVLGSFGYLNAQDGRASPEMASSEPEAQPRGSPASYATVLRSFGYRDWQYGRASPLAASLELAARSNGSAQQNTTVLKSIGYMDWQDGHALAVVDDGEDGVRLIHEGELLDDNRFRVVKVYPEAVEIVELPITPPGLTGDPTFQPYARQTVAAEIPLPSPLKKPLESVAGARLVHKEGQSSQLNAGPASVPNGSSLTLVGFALRGPGVPCFDFKSLLMMRSARPGPWSFSALNLYFPLGTRSAFPKAASATCAGALAYRP